MPQQECFEFLSCYEPDSCTKGSDHAYGFESALYYVAITREKYAVRTRPSKRAIKKTKKMHLVYLT